MVTKQRKTRSVLPHAMKYRITKWIEENPESVRAAGHADRLASVISELFKCECPACFVRQAMESVGASFFPEPVVEDSSGAPGDLVAELDALRVETRGLRAEVVRLSGLVSEMLEVWADPRADPRADPS